MLRQSNATPLRVDAFLYRWNGRPSAPFTGMGSCAGIAPAIAWISQPRVVEGLTVRLIARPEAAGRSVVFDASRSVRTTSAIVNDLNSSPKVRTQL